MEVKGTIHTIGQTQQVSDKFRKREFIVMVAGQYPQHLSLQLAQDKCSLIDSYKVGQNITAQINLNGRLWTNKEGVEVAFNTLDCWKIDGEFMGGAAPIVPDAPGDNLPF